MKIEIDLMSNGIPYIQQMEAVDNYIKNNTTHTEVVQFLGIDIAKNPQIKETVKNTGEKIGKFHVSCKRTKGGIYKFNVWQAV